MWCSVKKYRIRIWLLACADLSNLDSLLLRTLNFDLSLTQNKHGTQRLSDSMLHERCECACTKRCNVDLTYVSIFSRKWRISALTTGYYLLDTIHFGCFPRTMRSLLLDSRSENVCVIQRVQILSQKIVLFSDIVYGMIVIDTFVPSPI